jgi:glutamate-1-semialdehyde 2,1-aminomutase
MAWADAASKQLYERALRVMVGGVSSPVRAFRAVGGTPLFMVSGEGSRIRDADKNEYIDYVCSWGPLILGHAHPTVVKAVIEAVKQGTSFGASTPAELALAEKVCATVRSVEKVRFVNSGTEATMSAHRLARGFTSRNKLLKFDGCYHGHGDSFLTHAGSGLATLDLPSSAGLPPYVAADTITVPYNDVGALEAAFRDYGSEIAAAIVEPVAGNMGVVPPEPGFLQSMRKLCTQSGALLIFDEVITGFRVAPGGAQELYGVKPDVTTLGKIIGGGFPVGAYGGREEIMRMLAPDGPVYQAGTLSGNPVSMAAGLATLSHLDANSYATLERVSSKLERGLLDSAASARVPVTVNRVGSMIGLFFGSKRVRSFADAKATNAKLYVKFHRVMLTHGVYLPPSAFETIFVSTAHTEEDIELTIEAARAAFRALAR